MAPQKYDSRERKEGFWNYLNKEAQSASSQGTGLIIEMDGDAIIKGDEKKQNQNGRLFENFLQKIRM